MAKRLAYDRVLFLVTLTLLTFGLVMVFSASAMVSMARYQSPFNFLLRQAFGALLGLGCLWGMMQIDYRRLKTPIVVYGALFLSVFLLGLAFLQSQVQHTHRWIHVGPLSIQPSEVAKPVLILFLAFFLESKLKQVNELRAMRPAFLYLLVTCLLVFLEPDLGTTVALVLIAVSMFYMAGLRLRTFAYSAAIAVPFLYLAVFRVHYRRERILAFLHPWADPQGNSFQIVQSLIAVGTGGVTGLGLMSGKQKLFFLPEPQTDFIFAVIGEELGLLGSAILLALFVVFLYRGLRIARRAPDAFGRLLATGITTMVVVQALINFSVVTGLMPTKGIPLPFISYGSSSLVATLWAVGVLLNISQYT